MFDFPKRILVATDGSEAAELAFQAAADISSSTGSDLHLVHVWPGPPLPPGRPYSQAATIMDDFMREPELEARELLRRQAWRAEVAGATVAGKHLREGRPAKGITRLAEEIGTDLVVVGSRGLGAIERLFLGSVSGVLAQSAPCPVLVVQGEWPPSRIVIGDDFSEEAGRAGQFAAGIGKLYGAPVLLTTAFVPNNRYISYAANRRLARETERRLERELQGRAAVLERSLGEKPHTEVAPRRPDSVLRRASESGSATLVAVGSRGLGGVKSAVLVSVSAGVLRAASGPVLVAPTAVDGSLDNDRIREHPSHRGRRVPALKHTGNPTPTREQKVT